MPEVRVAMLEQADAVRAAYEATIADDEFKEAVESDTAGIPHTADRFRVWGQNLGAAIAQQLSIPQIQQNAVGQVRFVG